MNTAERQAAWERCERATAGPWHAELTILAGMRRGGRPNGEVLARFQCNVPTSDATEDKANCTFTAHARTDLPDALDEIDRLRAALSRIACYGEGMILSHLDEPASARIAREALEFEAGEHKEQTA